MDTTLQAFLDECFSKARTVVMDGEPWFVAVDACFALGIVNSRAAVDRLHADDVRQANIIDSMGRNQITNVINESGLYTLILRSDKPSAHDFLRWVTTHVLPTARKRGKDTPICG